MTKRRHPLIVYFLLVCADSFCTSDCSPFSTEIITHYYFGDNLNLFNSQQPFDTYSLFQYIFDFGTCLKKQITPTLPSSIALNAQVRAKGFFGNAGSSLQTSGRAIKIGWGGTETATIQEIDKSLIWIREVDLTYQPTDSHENYFRIGMFPFKIGNGLVLGNAYKIKIPIPGQYVYEQIDQFRPGLLLALSNVRKTVGGSVYLGIIRAESTDFEESAANTNMQNLDTPFGEQGANKGNVLAVAQMNFVPLSTSHSVSFSPYLLVQNAAQSIEFFNDATSNLATIGLYGNYGYDGLDVTFECAKNFGYQHVKGWDRNQLMQANGVFNTYLFYTSDQKINLANVNNSDFSFSPIPVTPSTIALSHGNGGTFAYSPAAGTSFIFKNAYDRFRNGYKNKYTGFLAYLDCLIKTRSNFSLGMAFAYASGADNPNDSTDTLLMTRLTPGIRYKDYDKKYKGFVGIEQLFEGKSINPLYFAQAQKMNQPFTSLLALTTPQFTNQGFFGTTLRYTGHEHETYHFSAQGTCVAYFMATSIKKGLSASLWQSQSLDFTDQMRVDMMTSLPQYLGTEYNFSLDYNVGPDLTFSLLGAFFFPGKFYKRAAGKTISLALQTQINAQNFGPDDTTPPTFGSDTSFFLSAALTCLFDFADWKNCLTNTSS